MLTGGLVASAVLLPVPADAATDRTAPTKPTGLRTTTVAATQVGLAWAKSTDNVGVAGYYLYRGTTRRTVTGTTYLDTGLTRATSYTYSVAAFDKAGNVSARSSSLTVRTSTTTTTTTTTSTTTSTSTTTTTTKPPTGLPPLPALPAPPPAPTTSGGVVLTGCTAITAPGTYVLTADLVVPADSTCLDVHDTSNVTVDCRGHTLTSAGSTVAVVIVNVANVTGFNLYNCTIRPAPAGAPNYLNEDLALTNVTGGTIQHDQFLQRTLLVLQQTTGVSFTDDKVDGMVQSDHGSANTFRWLRAGMSGFQGSAILSLGFGDHETVQYATIDGGGGTGINGNFGMDDGLLLQWGTSATIDSNVIANVWDCDIETMGLVTGSQFTNNQLNNAVSCGIGGWWWSSWRSNVVRNNRVDSSANLMSLYRLGGLDTARGETTVYFDHNSFDSNGLSHPTGANGGYVDLTAADNPALAGVPVVLGSNLVTNNDWSESQSPPILAPATMFTDGGGNRCKPSSDVRTQTVRCS